MTRKMPSIILILIVLIGLFLRIYKLVEIPLYGDELTMVYDSYSLLKVGSDQLGNKFPINFSMGEGRPAGYVYASIPFVAVFGPGVWGVRALSILSGLGIIVLSYFIGNKLFNRDVGIIAAFLTAFNPWEISLSRGGYESHFALFLALLGVYFFISTKDKTQNLIWGMVTWGMAMHTYPTYRIVLPLFLPWIIKYLGGLNQLKRDFKVRYIILATSLFIFFTLSSLQQTFTSSSIDRVRGVSVFSNKELREALTQKINYDRSVNQIGGYAKYFHNKPIEQSLQLLANYVKNISPEYLYIYGDGNPRHNMAEIGEFYWIEIIFVILGFAYLVKNDKFKNLLLIVGWILVSPTASALTGEPHALRQSFLLIPILYLSSLGIYFFANRLLIQYGNTFKILIIAITFIPQYILFFERLYFLAPAKNSRFWSETARTASYLAISKKDSYDMILLSDKIDNIEYAYQVYAKLKPREIVAQNRQPVEMQGVKELKRFDNVLIGQFPDTDRLIESLQGKVLYIGDLSEKNEFTRPLTLLSSDQVMGLVIREKI